MDYMADLMKYISVEKKMLPLRGQYVILDSDVAELYDVQTKAINQAVRNNPNKFPKGYILELAENEWKSLRSKILTLEEKGKGKHTKYLPKAFTERKRSFTPFYKNVEQEGISIT
jgi:hypothetical protein